MPARHTSFDLKASEREAFIAHVWEQGAQNARNDLPWRFLDDPYAVWISEVMLQQTQVSRVLSYWPRWMKQYPTVDALSSAATSDVLESWQGLGYNRRALALKRAADICAHDWQGSMPTTYDELLSLPGIGPATAAGITAFAYQKPAVYVETNVRAVVIHHFFEDVSGPVHDADIAHIVEQTCSTTQPREWYYALLDYGHYLKKTHSNPARNAAAYTRQSAFEGSHRQKRSCLVREALAQPGASLDVLHEVLNEQERSAGREAVSEQTFLQLAQELEAEGFFRIEDNHIWLS